MNKSRSKRTNEIYTLHLSRDKLLKAPEHERNLFFLLGHIANDVLILNRLFFALAHTKHPKGDLLSTRFGTAQALLVGKLITSKMHEAWNVIQSGYFRTSVSRKYKDILPVQGGEALDYLKKYFSRKNIVTSVRNEFGFHYPVEKLKNALSEISETEELVLYLSKSGPNTLYYACDLVPNHEMIRSIGEEDLGKSYDRLIVETSDCVNKLSAFIQNYMIAFIETNDVLQKKPSDNDKLIYFNLPRLKSFEIPAIFDARGIKD